MNSFASKDLPVQQATKDLLSYCRRHDWAGYDPYDALNSRIFSLFPFLRVKAIQWPFTQCMKRCPINLRPLFLVPHTRNPKGIALFVSALIKLHKSGVVEDQQLITDLANDLIALKSPDQSYVCWGYSFAWQTRSIVVPKGTPNIICTSFAANALLDAYEAYQDDTYLDAASSAADFLLEVLYEDGDQPCFNYTPLEVAQVHNANLLGAALLTRVSHHTGSDKWLEPALTASRFSAEKQHPDGSWSYGEGGGGILSQQWIDNFHTGYNLCALQTTGRYARTAEFDHHVTKGLAFYKDHFFLPDGTPKYYHNRTYPIDIHSVAQSVITLVMLRDLGDDNLALAQKVCDWGLDHMRDQAGYFYFQKGRIITNRIPYMRWTQAWMLLALSTLLEVTQDLEPNIDPS